jgi:hypothetical protein
MLVAGPQTYGFEGERWTSKRVKWLIEFKFGVKLHRAHVSRLLREQLGWSVQKPVEKASLRDEEAIVLARTKAQNRGQVAHYLGRSAYCSVRFFSLVSFTQVSK